jgi:enamine deaminase RidA (YjgF/YER057c/UK114 family)
VINRYLLNKRMSQIVIHKDQVLISGQLAPRLELGAQAQTEDILARIDELLQQAGTDKSRVLSANIWVSSMEHFDEMNCAWEDWVDPENPPVRACVQAELITPKHLIEIQVSAVK